MRKLLGLVAFLLVAFPTAAGKDEDVTVCVLPVHANWSGKSLRHMQIGKPPQPGEFLVDMKVSFRQGDVSTATSGSLEGYVGVACEVPGAVKMTFHHSLMSGWEATPTN